MQAALISRDQFHIPKQIIRIEGKKKPHHFGEAFSVLSAITP
jgi:hypothetical protein